MVEDGDVRLASKYLDDDGDRRYGLSEVIYVFFHERNYPKSMYDIT